MVIKSNGDVEGAWNEFHKVQMYYPKSLYIPQFNCLLTVLSFSSLPSIVQLTSVTSLAALFLDGNISRTEVENKGKALLSGLDSSTSIIQLSRQLKRLEATCGEHFCGFWNECKGKCQYGGKKAAWVRDVCDIYTPLDIQATATSMKKSASGSSLTQVWLEEVQKIKAPALTNLVSNISVEASDDDEGDHDDKDLDIMILEARLSKTEAALKETKSKLAEVLSAKPVIPPYPKKPLSEEELREMKRLQDLETECWMNVGTGVLPSIEWVGHTKPVSSEPLITIGGVPEHFNHPWHMAIQSKLFEKAGLNVKFVEVPGGTGKMMEMLRKGELDVAVALTEGIVANIANDAVQPSNVAIVGTYVSSPLTWGISVDAKSPYTTVSDLYNSKIGISRFGSGSHLMSFLLAEQQGWKVKAECGEGIEFVVQNNITEMVQGLKDGTSDVFLWETFMTKPWYDNGTLRKVGEIVTPWPCFLAASRRDFLDKEDSHMARRVTKVMDLIRSVCSTFKAEKQASVQAVADKHSFKLNDAAAWFSRVAYPKDNRVSRKVLQDALNALSRLGLIKGSVSVESLVDRRVGCIVDDIDYNLLNYGAATIETDELPRAINIRPKERTRTNSFENTKYVPTEEAKISTPMSARAAARKQALDYMKLHMGRS
jgi:sulfonate transport system substrate-binding protein